MFKHPKIFLILSLSILLMSFAVNAQSQVDSLKMELQNAEGKSRLKILIKLGYFLSSENPNEAIKYLDEAIELSDETHNKWSKADAFFNKGVALWHLGEINNSDDFYEKAIPIYEEFHDSLSLIKVFNSQAINHQMKGDINLAVETFFHSLDYAKKINDKATILNTLLNIGVLYDNSGDTENGLKYYLEALDYADGNDRASLALLQSYIAEIYIHKSRLNEAEEYLNKAIENSRASGDSKSLIWAYTNLGQIQLKNGKEKTAENYFKESLKLARSINYKLEIIHALTELGKYYNNTKNYAEAEKNLKEAVILSEEINSLTDLSILNQELAALYYNTGDYKKAYELRVIYKQYSDSLYAIANSEKIEELQTKHELKQKDRETKLLMNENELQKKIIYSQKVIALIISLLAIASIIIIWLLFRNRNKILKAKDELVLKNKEINLSQIEISQKNEVLAGLNATKDKFFSIIAHDLRNPIAAFVNISELLEEDFDRLNEKDKKEIIGQMNVSSKNLLRLLENLLTWARLSNNKIEVYPEKVLLTDVVEAAVHSYIQAAQNKKIKLNVNVPKDILITTDKFIFQAIIGNLINNAVKFSNSLSEISIGFISQNGHYHFSVKDHGIGIEPSQLRNIFVLGKVSTGRGTMGESGTGLGLVLVKELVEKLNWQIIVKSEVNAGSEFIVSIPKSDVEL
ncbi:MAG: tetratricopeptide repeat-containing sensor histidine kinase [Ignavibacteriota bacterium]